MAVNDDHVKFLPIIHNLSGKLILRTESVWSIKIVTSISEVPISNLVQRVNDFGQSVSLFLSVPPFEYQKNTLKIVKETFKFIQVGRPWLISGDKQRSQLKKQKNLMFAVAVRKKSEDCWILCSPSIRIPCNKPFEFSQHTVMLYCDSAILTVYITRFVPLIILRLSITTNTKHLELRYGSLSTAEKSGNIW